MRKKDWLKQEKFSIRKYNIGAFSVAIGATLLFGGNIANADTTDKENRHTVTATTRAANVTSPATMSLIATPSTEENNAKSGKPYEEVVKGQNVIAPGDAYSNEVTGERKDHPGKYLGSSNIKQEEAVKKNISIEKHENADGTTNWKVTFFPNNRDIIVSGDGKKTEGRDNKDGVYSLVLSDDLDFVGNLTFSTSGYNDGYDDATSWDIPSIIHANKNGGLDIVEPNNQNETPQQAVQAGHVLTGDYKAVNDIQHGTEIPIKHRSALKWIDYFQNGNTDQNAGLVDWEAFYTAGDKRTGALRLLFNYNDSGNILNVGKDNWFGGSDKGYNLDDGQGYRLGFGKYLRFGLWSQGESGKRKVTLSFTTKNNGTKTLKGVSDTVLVGYTNNHNGSDSIIGYFDGHFNNYTDVVENIKIHVNEKVESEGLLPEHNISINQTANASDKMSGKNMASTNYNVGVNVIDDSNKNQIINESDYTFLAPIHKNKDVTKQVHANLGSSLYHLSASELAKVLNINVSNIPGWKVEIQPVIDDHAGTITYNLIYKAADGSDFVSPNEEQFNDIVAKLNNELAEYVKDYGETLGNSSVDSFHDGIIKKYVKYLNNLAQKGDTSYASKNELAGLSQIYNLFVASTKTASENSLTDLANLLDLNKLVQSRNDLKDGIAFIDKHQLNGGVKLADEFKKVQNSLAQELTNIDAHYATDLQKVKDALENPNNPLWQKATDAKAKEDLVEYYSKLTNPNSKLNTSYNAYLQNYQKLVDTLNSLDGTWPNEIDTKDSLAQVSNTGDITVEYSDQNANIVQIRDKDGNVLASFAAEYEDVLDNNHLDANGKPIVVGHNLVGFKQIDNDFANGIKEVPADFNIKLTQANGKTQLVLTPKNKAIKEDFDEKRNLDVYLINNRGKLVENKVKNENNAEHLVYNLADKTDLLAEVNKENTVKDSIAYLNADQDKVNAYNNALVSAKELLAKENTDEFTLKNLNSHLAALKQARENLNGKATNFDKLKEALQAANDVKQTNKHLLATADLKDNFDKLLDEATKAVKNNKAKQTDVDALASKLSQATNALDGQTNLNKAKNALGGVKDQLTAEHFTNFTDQLSGDPIKALAKDNFNLADYVTEIQNTAKQDLANAKAKAIADLNKLDHLSDVTKADFARKIDTAQTLKDVKTQAVPADALNTKVKEAMDTVNALPHLTADERSQYLADLMHPKNEQATELVQTADLIADSLQKAQAQDALNLEKTKAKQSIDQLKNLADDAKNTYKENVQAAKSAEKIQTILEQAKADDAKVLAKAKEKVNETIAALPNLDQTEIAGFVKQVASVDDKADLPAIIEQANALNNLKQAKKDANAEIDKLKNLEDNEKQAIKNDLASKTDISDVNASLEKAKELDTAKLNEAKTAAKQTINGLPYLTKEEQTAYNKQIAALDDKHLIPDILADAKAKNALTKAKNDANTTIAALPNLSDEEKQDYLNNVKTADQPSAVNTIVSQAKATDAKNLKDAKDNANAIIAGLDKLDKAQQSDFVSQVNAQTNKANIPGIIKAAQTANDLNAAKEEAQKAINQLKNIEDADKKQALSDVLQAQAIEDIAPIVSQAKTNDQTALENAKDDANTKLDVLDKLTKQEKKQYQDLIAGVDDKHNLPEILANAKKQNELNAAKEEAKTFVNGLKNLEDADKTLAKEAINQAADLNAVNSAKQTAQRKDQAILQAAQNQANQEIAGLAHLTPDEVQNFKQRVDAVDDKHLLKDIVDEAKALNQLKDAKEKAKTSLDQLVNLDPKEKQSYQDEITNGNDLKNVSDALEKAQTKDSANLNAAKDKANKTIDALKNLDADAKAAVKENIATQTNRNDLPAIVEAAKTADQNALNEAKKQANAEISALTNLTEEEVQNFTKQVNAQDDKANIPAIVEQARQADGLNKAKTDAKKAIDALKNLDASEKTTAKEQIDEKTTAAEIPAIVSSAQDQDAKNLKAAKEHANKTIEGLENLTKAQKADFVSQVNPLDDRNDIPNILEQAKKLNVLNGQKTDAKKTIDQLANLSNEEKEGFKAEIADAIDKPAIDALVTKAQQQDAAKLQDAKDKANAAIAKNENLLAADKKASQKAVNDANTIDAVTTAKEAADQKAKENLANKQSDANGIINGLENLTNKDSYLKEIKDAKTLAEVDGIVNRAQTEDANGFAGKQQAAKEAVDALKNLTAEEKDSYKQNIATAKTPKQVDDDLQKAKEADHAKLVDKQTTGKNTVDALANLTNEQKDAFNTQIKNADNIADIDKILKQAKETDATNLQDAKDKANEAIDNNPNLLAKDKQTAHDAVNAADSIEKVKAAQNAADQIAAKNLQDAKYKANEEIAKLPNLSSDEKQTATANVNASQTLANVSDALANAKALNDLNAEKTQAKADVDSLLNLDEAAKKTAKDAIANANNNDQIADIVKQAKIDDANVLQAAKEKANEAIHALENLKPAEQESFKEEVASQNNKANIPAIIEKAKQQDSLNKAKADALKQINDLLNIEDNDRNQAVAELNTAGDTKAVEKVLLDAKTADENALNKAKAASEKQLDDLKHLSKEELAGFKDEISAITNKADLPAIVEKAKAQDTLNAEKSSAKDTIDALENLTVAEKQGFDAQINNAKDKTTIDDVLQKAQAADAAKLDEAKVKANAAIDENKNLLALDKQTAHQAVNEATNINGVEIAQQAADVKAKQNLADKKQTGNAIIDGLESLTDKDAYHTEIASANTLADVDDILAKAKAENATGFKEKQAEATKAIDALPNLDEAEKNAAKKLVNEASQVADLTKAVSDAKAKDQANLTDAKNKAKADLAGLTHLTDSQKDAFTKQIDDQTARDNIPGILDQARQQDKLNDAKDKAKKAIDALKNLDEKAKTAAKNNVDAQTQIDAIAPIVDTAKVDDTNALNEAKQNANQVLDALTNLSPKEIASFKEEVGLQDDKANIPAIIEKAKQQDALNKAKTDGKAAIDELKNLDANEKTLAKNNVDIQTQIADITAIVNAAKATDAKNLQDAKDTAKQTIDALENLSKEQKQEFDSQVQATDDKANIPAIIDQANKLNDLNGQKADANQTINSLVNLSADEKQAHKEDIANATSKEQIDAIVEKAKADDANNLQAAKDKANEDIDGLANLTDTEKQSAKANVNAQNNKANIPDIVEQAKKQDGRNLANAKTKADQALDDLLNLTDEQKQTVKTAIEDATKVSDINDLVTNAKKQDKTNLADAKDKADKAIDALPNLTNEQKQTAKDAIKDATKVSDVNEIVEQAKQDDAKNLANAKKKANGEVYRDRNLSTIDRGRAHQEINAAKTIEEVQEALARAKQKAAENLAKAKEDANKTINGLTNLTDKDPYLTEVSAAKNLKEVAKAVEKAMNAAGQNLTDAKQNANKLIDALPNLTTEQKQTAKDAIKDANQLSDISDLVEQAKRDDANNLSAAKEEANKAIDAFKNLDDTAKQTAKENVNAQTDKANIAGIVEQAKQDDQAILSDAKTKASQVIDALKNLDEEAKTAVKNEIAAQTDKANIPAIVQKAKQDDAANLADAKTKANEAIDALKNLDETAKTTAKNEIAAQDNKANIPAIVEKAKEDDAQKLADAKNKSNQVIDTLPNLTDEQKTNAKQAIKDADNVSDINELVKQARQNDAQNLIDAKDKANNAIDANANLLDEDKTNAHNAINVAETTKAVEKALEDANQKAQENLTNAKTNANNTINGLENLTNKDNYLNEVNAAKTLDEVAKIVERAKAEDANGFAGKQDGAKQQIKDLKNLDAKEKEDFTNAIETAKNPEAIDKIVKDAKQKDSQHLADKQKDANKAIDKLDNLTEQEKSQAKEDVASADNIADIDKIVQKATQDDATNLTNAKDKADKTIDALPNLTDEQKTSAKQAIKDANKVSDVSDLVKQAKQDDAANLADAKTKANEAIDALKNLDDAAKTTAKNDIAAQTDKANIPAIVEKARQDDTANLADAKTKANKVIDALKNIDDDAKTAAKNEIAAQDDKANIPSIVEKAKQQDQANLEDAKTKANKAIDALKNLDEEAKTNAKNDIAAQTDKANIPAIVEKAKQQDQANLEDAKTKANEAIDALKNLSDNEKAQAKANVASQDVKANIPSIVEKARQDDANNLSAAKDKANQNVDANPNLLAEDKEAAHTTINSADSIKDVEQAIADANKKANENLDNAKNKADKTINGLANLTDKDSYLNEIKDANTLTDVNEIVERAKAEDANGFAGKQDSAKQQVENLKNLDPKEKEDFTNAIDAAKTPDAVDQIIKDAKSKDAEHLAEAKQNAKQAIDGLKNLDDAAKTTAKNEIESQDDKANIPAIVEKARKDDEANLADAKTKANEVIDGLKNLDEDAKIAAKNEIAAQDDKANIPAIVEKARKDDATNLADAKTKANEAIDALKNLSDDEKAQGKANVAAQDDKANIPGIVEKAKQQDQANLEDAKTKANKAIDALKNLDENAKTTAKTEIASQTDKANIPAIVEKARQDDAQKLADAKNNANQVIDKLPNLTKDQKTSAKQAVNNADSTTDIDSLVEKARQDDTKNLVDAKDKANKAVDANANLLDEDKETAHNAINAAETTKAVETASAQAEQKALENLTNAKTNANKTINGLENLTNKDNYLNEVSEAKTLAEVANIVERAKSEDANGFAGKQDSAKQQVESLKNLDDKEKEDFTKAIDTAKTPDAVDQIIKDAKAKDSEHLAEAKQNAKQVIDALKNLDDAAKTTAKNEIASQDDKANIPAIVEKAREDDKTSLEDAKTKANNAIDGLKNLDDEAKTTAKNEIAAQTDKANIPAIVEKAKQDDAANLADAKDQANKAIDALKNLDEKAKTAAKNEIAAQDNKANIPAIVKKAREDDKTSLEDAKTKANNAIDALKNLDEEAKTTAKNEIAAQDDKASIPAIVEKAKQDDAANLADAKDQANKAIDALKNLDEKAKTTAKNEIAAQDNKANIPAIVEKAKQDDAAKLADAKSKANEVIDALNNLTPAEKQTAKENINAQTDKANIPAIVEKARQDDATNLADAKTKANETIDALKNLDEDAKTAAKNEIATQTDKANIPAIVEKARQDDAQKLADAKDKANKAVDANANLLDEDKTNAHNAINAAETTRDVETALTQAEQKAQENLTNAKTNANNTINDLENLTNKDNYLNEVNAAKTLDEVAKIVERAKAEDANGFAGKQDSAKQQIEDLKNLDAKEKEDFTNAIETANNPEAIDKIVKDAKQKDSQHLADKQKDANKAIDKLDNLTEQEKSQAKEDVASADNIADIDNVVEKATQDDATNLTNAKDKADKTIDALPNLTDEQKATAKQAIKDAKKVSDVSDLVKQAKQDDAANLADAKTKANEAIDALKNLDDAAKTTAKNDIAEQTDKANIPNIVEKAREDDAAKLADAKAKANDAIDALKNLDDAAKATVKNEIAAQDDKANIPAIVEKARQDDAANLSDAKAKANETIEALKNLDEDAKTAAKNEIAAQTDKANIPSIVEKAKQDDKASLADAKTKSNEVIDALNNLTPAEKQTAKENINAQTDKANIPAIVEKARQDDATNLADAKTKANETIDALKNLDENAKTAAKNEIAAQTDKANIPAIVEKARQDDAKNLADAKEKAEKAIDANPNLLAEDKKTADNAINASETLLDVETALESAKQKAEANLVKAKDNAENTINGLENLTNKDSYLSEINDAKTLDELAKIVDRAQLEDAKGFAGKQDGAKQQIEDLKNLDDKEKQDLTNAIDKAKTPEVIDQIIKDAKKTDANHLAEKQTNANKEIDALENLTDKEKSQAKEDIQNADKISDVDKIVEQAKETDATNLADAKKNADKTIDDLANLTDDQKQTAKDAIKDADKVSDINDLVQKAKQDDAKNLQDAKDKANKAINSNANLLDEDKTNAHNAINSATTTKNVEKALADANAKALENLSNAKENADKAIDALHNLTDDQKTNAKEAIKDADKLSDVDDLVEKAKQDDAANLADAKQDAHKQIDSLENLDESAITDLHKQIENADQKTDIAKIVENAKISDAANLAKAKETAKETIDGLQHLADNIKHDLMGQVDHATNIAQVDEIVDMAKKLDKLTEYQEHAKHEIDQLDNLSDEQKQNAKDAIDQAADFAGVDHEVEKAKQADLDNLKKQQNEAHKVVDGLTNLTDEQNTAFHNAINKAHSKAELDAIIKQAQELNNAAKQLTLTNKEKTGKQALPETANDANLITTMGVLAGLITALALKRKKED